MKTSGILISLHKTWVKPLAALILIHLAAEIFWPMKALALTGGPSQPEVESFEPVGTTDMVDLFTGDFNYNIPLFDVGGYPVNLAYHGGIGMDQEASWVGLGWNINPGVINRTMRGIPDDFNGDRIKREVNIEPNRTWAASISTDLEIFGWGGQGKDQSKTDWNRTQHNRGKFQFGFGVIHNNNRGWGYSLDLKYDISKTAKNPDKKEPGSDEKSRDEFSNSPLSGSVGLSANSQDGANWNFSANYSWQKPNGLFNRYKDFNFQNAFGFGLGYNSFSGVNDFALNVSSRQVKKGATKKDKPFNGLGTGSAVPIGTTSYFPSSDLSFRTSSITFNGTLGFEAFGGHPDFRIRGFWNKEELENDTFNSKAFGYFYENKSESFRGQSGILLDFNREKDGAYNKYRTHLPLCNPTYDLYSVQGQGTGGMYRPHHTSVGSYYSPKVESRPLTNQIEIGLDLGFGINAHIGNSLVSKDQYSYSGLWISENSTFLNKYNRPAIEDGFAGFTYFKAGGELTPSDEEFNQAWMDDQPINLKIGKVNRGKRSGSRFARIETTSYPSAITNKHRQIRANAINFLNATEASNFGIGLDPNIVSFLPDYWDAASENRKDYMVEISRTSANGRKEHHISEITSITPDGSRYVYGIPIYNSTQMDVSFAISPDNFGGDTAKRDMYPDLGLVKYNPGFDNDKNNNQRGPDHYFEKTTMPGYAHSYLLTGVLSADYVDVTGDGITDDDLGSAVKFNYQRTSSNYQWRNPYGEKMAMLEQGFLADPTDDKAAYSYGKKEMWYLHSIVSRTHIAEFKLSLRDDGAGVASENGGYSGSPSDKSYKLDSIIVYSKWDRLKNGNKATPVKTIVFQYDYSLCPGVLNNSNINGGKLTLKAIYYTYGKSNKGTLSPYKFTYSNTNPGYDQTKYDRWGNYKEPNGVANRFYPYVDQTVDSATQASYSSAWNLEQIDLPSGGKIKVKYEADDYAYVQDKRAMQMVKIIGSSLEKPRSKKSLTGSLYQDSKEFEYLTFESLVPYNGGMNNASEKRQFVIDNYLKDAEGKQVSLMAYRFKVNMNPASETDNWEYISGYVQLSKSYDFDSENQLLTKDEKKKKYASSPVICGLFKDGGKTFCYVKTNKVKQGDMGLRKANPISKRAWQIGLQHLRKILYPGSDQQIQDDGKSEKALRGLLGSMATALNLLTGPNQNLRWKNVASRFKKKESFIRFYNPNFKKFGGGCRVKELIIDDQWKEMGGSQESSIYGQSFDYTSLESINGKLQRISSGVAQYEPLMGNDENPFRMPAFYKERVPAAPDIEDYYEEPFGESFFPGATVGYSKVTVRNIPKPGAVATATGKTVHLFYTAKDFPIMPKWTNLHENGDKTNSIKRKGSFLKNLFSPIKKNAAAATQGYVIKLNDMHGKPKGVKIHSELGKTIQNPDGDLISGTEYRYKTDDNITNINNPFTEVGDSFPTVPKGAQLNNHVWTLNDSGRLEIHELGKEMDVAIDLRSTYSKYEHTGVELNNDQFFIANIPMPWPKYLVHQNLFQGVTVTKIIQQYGILEETIAYDHSSAVRTKNLVWDKESGSVLLTATTNEFDDPIYNFSYPAHFVYDGMGGAYKNIDREALISLNASGWGAADSSYFFPGDELLVGIGGGVKKGWVIRKSGNMVQVVDRAGLGISGYAQVKVIRSGRRNHLGASVGQVVTMNRNIRNGDNLILDKDVVSSAAMTFSEDWPGYLKKAYKTYKVCDTINSELVDLYRIIKYVVANTQQENYVYNNFNERLYDLNNIWWFANSELAAKIENSTGGLVFCTGDSLVHSQNYGVGFDSSNFQLNPDNGLYRVGFAFANRYKCGTDTNWQNIPFSCGSAFQFDTSSCHFDLSAIDSLSNEYYTYYVNSGGSITWFLRTKAYSGGDYCWVTFYADCATYKINCYNAIKCEYVLGEYLNPYVNGLKGNWRQKEAFALQGSRKYLYAKDTTDIRHDGLIQNYTPYWEFRNNKRGLFKDTSSGIHKWVSTGKTTIITPEGNGVESQDALGIYSAQLFGYNQTLAMAVASNARYQQIAFDNFEDYNYPYYQCNRDDHWNFKEDLPFEVGRIKTPNSTDAPTMVLVNEFFTDGSGDVGLDKSISHTGNYSIRINAGQSHHVIRQIDFSNFSTDTSHSSLYKFTNISNAIKPFSPTKGKYVFGGWVHEGHSNQNDVNSFEDAYVNIKVFYGNGTGVVEKNIEASGVIINGWQRMEGYFEVPTAADSIKITLVNEGVVQANFDDLRIHTYNGNMKSFVYDPVLLKVSAELDENNYATFYEYDPEGNLVRVKKETERGIVTVQEARKSIRRTLP